MQPVFFVNQQSLTFGSSDAKRRSILAQWITSADDVWFTRAFVNRMWAELVGEPFYDSVDDIGPERPVKAPQTLELLCQGFTERGYDVKWLFETIMSTTAYSRAARPRRDADGIPFAANCVQRLRADQLANSLQHVFGNDLRGASGPNRKAQGGGQRGLQQEFGFDPSENRREVGGSIPQSLVLMNSPQLARLAAVSLQRGDLSQILKSSATDEAAIRDLYLKILARSPTADEIATCQTYLKSAESAADGYQDIVWALLNSSEFLYRY